MIQTIELLTWNSFVRSYIPTLEQCLVLEPFAIHCTYVRKFDYTAFHVSHIKSKCRIWVTSSRKDALDFTHELMALDLDWDFQNTEEVPLQTSSEAASLIADWDAKQETDDDDDDRKDEIREERAIRKLRERRLRNFKRRVKQGQVNPWSVLLALLPCLVPSQIDLIVNYQNDKQPSHNFF